MDLIPKPDQVVSAASNVAHSLLYGGLADLRPMPRTLIDEGVLREVYHYRPRGSAREQGDPVLLVTPLAAPSLCFDLRRGCSLVEHLVEQGRPTYLVEYGEVSFANRTLGMEHWVDEVLPQAIEEVSRHAGGRPVHVVGWSMGSLFALLTAADRPQLPIKTLTMLGGPIDVSQVPLVAPIRPLLGLAGERSGLITHLYRLLGGAPKPVVRRAFQLASVDKMISKPLAIATHLDDRDFLAQIEAVDRFMANMIAYPGRTFGQIYHRILKGNQLASGTVTMDDRHTISLADVRAPLLVFAGASDGIAPVQCIEPITDLVPNTSVQFEVVPGGHLGMLTGRAARRTTWRLIDEFLDEHTAAPAASTTAKRSTAKRTTTSGAKATGRSAPPSSAQSSGKSGQSSGRSSGSSGRKSGQSSGSSGRKTNPKPARKSTKQGTAKPTTLPSSETIGSNPTRRYGSATSRSLASGR